MKLLNSLVVLLALLQISFAELCNAPTKTVTITVTDATQGVAFPTQNVNKGDTITWVNQRSSTIVVISTDTPRQFESPALGTGQSFSFKFDVPGSFNYWLLFELNSISLINVVNCDAFTTTASPSPTQVFSRTASPSVTAAQTPSPTPSFTPSRSGGRLPPSATPSPIDFCTGVPTNEVHLTPGAGVPIMENKTVAINAILSTAFMPLETEDVRITVTATGAIDFSVSAVQQEPFSNPICSWSTTNCLHSTQTFTLRCRTNFVHTVNDDLPGRVTWWANARNRVDREVKVDVRFLNMLREQKNPLVTTISMENFAGSTSVALTE